ncbi:MAG TPA: hypothetical protein VM532_12940 [Burkholderiales bacterium]|nr:hypothetical protein [Burkholderiales bacterium]
MKRNVIYFGATLMSLLLFPLSSAHAETYVAVNAVYCPSEEDVVEMAEARQGQILNSLMTQKVESGRCTASGSNKKIGLLIKRLTPRKKIPYYCFKEALGGGALGDRYLCVLQKNIVPLQQVVARRTGVYTSTKPAGNFQKVECAEGGTVTIERRGEEYYRISDALQFADTPPNPLPTHAGSNLERAIIDGCKGVDYLLENNPRRK